MACYRFSIDGVDTQVSIPSTITTDLEFNWETFIGDLQKQTNEEKTQAHLAETSIDKLVRLLTEHKREQDLRIEPINNIDKREAFTLVQKHLARLGVKMHILDTYADMQKYGFPEGTDAGVLDGEIYISAESSISSPMHEFLHLVFGVMKADNFNNFTRLMGLMASVEDFVKIKEDIIANPAYSGLIDLDKDEEAFVRYMSALLEEKLEISESFNKVYDDVNKIILPFIQKTFGIEQSISLMDFLKSPFSDLTRQGSALFIKRSLDTTGYSDNKYKAVISGKIMNYILELSTGDNPQIKEGDCQ